MKEFLDQKFAEWRNADRAKTIQDFSIYLGVEYGALEHWMSGRRSPRRENVAKLAEKLGIETYDAAGLARPQSSNALVLAGQGATLLYGGRALDLDFIGWLQGQLNQRDWKQSNLAKKGKINTGLLSQIMKGERQPGPGTLIKIADALGIPREMVFEKWGYLSTPTTEQERLLEQIQFNSRGLSLAELSELNRYAAYLLSQRTTHESNHED